MLNKNFAIFILTHGRPNNVITYETLKYSGYTGKTYIVVDDQDETLNEYFKNFDKEQIIVFNKQTVANTFDIGDSAKELPPAVVYARNASFQMAKELGLDYFMQLDDDYKPFLYRYIKGDQLLSNQVKSLDEVINALINFLDDSGALTVAMAQGGDFIGGKDGGKFKQFLLRKAMNSFIFRTNTPMKFVGRINEDANTYIVNGNRGELILTVTALMVDQHKTQQHYGGLTDLYLHIGTYMKSMYSVIMSPSCVKVRLMQTTHTRPHHQISWNNAVPKIINERHRKPRADTTPLP
jgi:hypothetical protein